ncbi:DUF5324 family protein [Naumannella halotolerans]|uniref:50S ribosomal protein L4 n=1 Tax=Naumannella halotolerans TaxID=993414 RepID=A0A4R7J5X0_9ACTN|nr:DUF5324 family protein [Naumannella halotolerans]TDT32762.1 hypothetical protein CLV29_0350 [Naumannella halotolerans]
MSKSKKKAAAEITHTAAKAGEDALNKISPYVESARDAIAPKLDEAIERITPAVEAARDRFEKDVLPRINEALKEAAEHPAAEEARKRGLAAAAALRGELSVPEPTKKKRKIFLPLLLIGLTAGIGYLLWKRLAGDSDEWETYGTTSWNPSNDFTVKEESTSQSFSEPVDVPEAGESASAAETTDVDAPAVDQPVAEGEAANYGPGSYVGDEPPVGYTIKGNARSMKYHTTSSNGYERTIADVWFADEASAEAAGFTRAQR